MKKIHKITEWIELYSNELIGNIEPESIDVYNFLKNEFSKSNVTENNLFQFVFRSFYRLDNAGLTPKFKKEYFRILELNRNISQFNFEDALSRLYKFPNRKGQNSFQFSFVTKLFNTINNSMPIYDSEVARMFSLSRPYQPEFEKKLDRYLDQFDIIQKGYEEIINGKLLPKTTELFDRKFDNNGLSKMKKIDFIFWSAGKIKDKMNKLKISSSI